MLNAQTYQQGMAKLQAVFHTNLDEIKGAAYWQALSRLQPAAFEYAVDEIIRNCRSFPKPVDIRETAGHYRDQVSEKQIAYEDDRYLPQDMWEKHVESAKFVLQMMFSDKFSREHKVEAFRHMEKAYPGIGWAHEGVKLEKYYESRHGVTGGPVC